MAGRGLSDIYCRYELYSSDAEHAKVYRALMHPESVTSSRSGNSPSVSGICARVNQRVENAIAELCFQMRRLVLRMADRIAKLRALRTLHRNLLVDRRVASNIRYIVRQGSQGEGVLVDIPAFEQQLTNGVPRCGRNARGC
jgi:hypothetical protein